MDSQKVSVALFLVLVVVLFLGSWMVMSASTSIPKRSLTYYPPSHSTVISYRHGEPQQVGSSFGTVISYTKKGG